MIRFVTQCENAVKSNLAITCVVVGTLFGSAVAMASESSDSPHPMTFVKDSAITTLIKTKLAAEHLTSLERIHVETDKDGVVWLSGTVSTQEAADKAVVIAHDTERVTTVHSDLKVKSHE
jgi:hyperosmotically inducible protein